MSGAMSRNKGNRAMVAVVNWLRGNGYPYASRRGGGDWGDDILEGFPGISIEVKDHARLDLAGWVDQAQSQAGGRPAIVIHKRRGKASPAEWYCTGTVADIARIIEPKDVKK